MIRIVVIDTQPLLRHGLVELVQRKEEFRVVGEASDCEDGCGLIARLQPDLIVFDLDLGEACGAGTLTHFREVYPELNALVYASRCCSDTVAAALSGRIQGYVLKTSPVERLLDALQRVADGGRYLDPALCNNLLGQPTRAPQLSEREQEILRLLCAGMTNKEIARAAGIGERTVKFHLSHIFHRLNARNRTDAVRLAEQHRLVRAPSPVSRSTISR